MLFHSLFELFFGMLLVLFSALTFVNAVEFIGCELKLGSSFVGTILSPLFTSLPELIVFVVALVSGVRGGEEISIGTIFGQPFMASSLSYSLVGIATLLGYLRGKRVSPNLKVDKTLFFPYAFVTILFPLTLIPGFEKSMKLFFGVLFLLGFILYSILMYLKRSSGIIEESEELYFGKFLPENVYSALIQLLVAVIILYYGSERLVSAVSNLSALTGISPLGISLILIPAATAIPETASAIVWGYRGKDTLSLGSLVGEKILYSTFYPGIALVVTSWKIDDHAFFSVLTTTIISFLILYYIRKEEIPWSVLLTGMFFFFVYSILIFVFHS